jgi:hypothetical protein
MCKQTLYQTNRHFSGGIRASGGFFLCLYYVSSVEKSYTVLNELYASLADSGALLEGQPGDYPRLLSAFGISAVFSSTGSPVKDSIRPGQFALADTGPGGKYWVCVDRNRKVIYSPDPSAADGYTLHTLKIFTYNT